MGMGLLAVRLEFNSLDIRDKQVLRQNHETYLNKGIMTINEVREDLQKEPLEGGDKAYIVVGNRIIFVKDLANLKSEINNEPENSDKEENDDIDLSEIEEELAKQIKESYESIKDNLVSK